MDKPTCSLDGCDRPVASRGYCRPHYVRWSRNGDPGSAEIQVRDPSRGCSVDGCNGKHSANSLCEKHWRRDRKHGDPLIVLPFHWASDAALGESHPRWSGDAIKYHGAHKRLARNRGAASTHDCIRCGETAKSWAYKNSAASEQLVEPETGMRFSTNPDDYMPMCATCHNHLDHGKLDQWLDRYLLTVQVEAMA